MFGKGPQEEDVYRTDRLLLTATKHKVPLRKAPAIATVITGDEIKDMGARNLTDVLKLIPGLGVSTNEHGVLMFEVRGIRTTLSEKILVMIDGHPLNNVYSGSALSYVFDDLTVENIAQIDMVRGPGSALYGANAFTAVINVITKSPNDIGGGEIKVSGGSFDSRKVNLLGGKIFENGIQVLGSLDYWKTNGPNLEINKDRLGNRGDADTEFEKTDLFLNLIYKDLSFKGQYIAKSRPTYIGFAYALTDGSSWHYDNYWGELSYRYQFSSQLASAIKVYHDYLEQDAKIVIMPNVIGEPALKDRATGTELQVDYDLFSGNHLLIGGLYNKIRQYDVRQIANFDPLTNAPLLGGLQDVSDMYGGKGNHNKDADREIFATYLQDEWAIQTDINLTAGVRYDHYSDFGDTVNPRAGLVLGITKQADLKFLYGEAFRAPNFVELYNGGNPIIIGNSDLQPEKIKTSEVGVTIRIVKSVNFDVNYFYSKINNLIDWVDSTTPGEPAVYRNLKDAVVDGIEMTLMGQYSNTSYWKLSYTYQDPRDADSKQRLPNVPSNRATASVNHDLTRYLVAHADLLWTGARPRPTGDPRPEMPDYTVVDLSLTAKDFYKGLEIQCALHNLFDQRYSDPDKSGAKQFVPGDFPREGFSAMLNISYSF